MIVQRKVNEKPPALAQWILRKILPDRDWDTPLGDFEEFYNEIARSNDLRKADLWYWSQVIALIPRKFENFLLWRFYMFLNYIKIAIRVISRQKIYSFINITGLAIGMAVCVLILLYVQDELSFDNQHQYKDRIYRIERVHLSPDGSEKFERGTLAPSFVPFLEADFPEFEHIARIYNSGSGMVKHGDRTFVEEKIMFAEDDIFEVFTIPFIKGNPQTALTSPGTIVISRLMAQKYFGKEDPIGKELLLDEQYLFKITGVMEDTPQNSHIHFEFLASYITLQGRYGEGENDYFHGTRNFSDNVCFVYARTAKGVEVADVVAKIPEFLDRHGPTYENDAGIIIKPSMTNNLNFRKVTDIHLHSHTSSEIEANSDIKYVRLFFMIAIFILLIACINFMNLSTAKAVKRAKEVGLRKVIGANRKLLVTQFLGESLIISLFALILAVILVIIVMPFFSAFSGHDISFNPLKIPIQLLLIIGIFIITGLIAGLYPAFYLSVFKPAMILRGEITRGSRGATFRKVLVVFQFAISVALIFCVSIVYKQMDYLQSVDLGYQRENILMFPADRVLKQKWVDVKLALNNHRGIIASTMSKRAPTGRLLDAPGFEIQINNENIRNPFPMPHNRVEHDFFRTYGMEIIAGRDFSVKYPTDSTEAFILNETAVNMLGLKEPQEAVDLPIGVYGNRRGKVIGVVKDFYYESLHHQIHPIVTYIAPGQANTVAVRLTPGNLREKIDHIQKVIDQYHPGYPLNYNFLDQRIDELYRNEARMLEMFGYFSLLAIFIACLGLFGLASFTTEQRTKEIGIRKVLGASVSKIVLLLSTEFTKWVLIASIIACPIAYYAIKLWLQTFAYRTAIGLEMFILAPMLAIAIALITVSYQAINAALTNPAKSLKYE